ERPGGGADHGGRAFRGRDLVVVAVLVRDEDEIRGHAGDRRVTKRHATRGNPGADVAERVDQHGLRPRDEKRGLAVPADDHQMRFRYVTTRWSRRGSNP